MGQRYFFPEGVAMPNRDGVSAARDLMSRYPDSKNIHESWALPPPSFARIPRISSQLEWTAVFPGPFALAHAKGDSPS